MQRDRGRSQSNNASPNRQHRRSLNDEYNDENDRREETWNLTQHTNTDSSYDWPTTSPSRMPSKSSSTHRSSSSPSSVHSSPSSSPRSRSVNQPIPFYPPMPASSMSSSFPPRSPLASTVRFDRRASSPPSSSPRVVIRVDHGSGPELQLLPSALASSSSSSSSGSSHVSRGLIHSVARCLVTLRGIASSESGFDHTRQDMHAIVAGMHDKFLTAASIAHSRKLNSRSVDSGGVGGSRTIGGIIATKASLLIPGTWFDIVGLERDSTDAQLKSLYNGAGATDATSCSTHPAPEVYRKIINLTSSSMIFYRRFVAHDRTLWLLFTRLDRARKGFLELQDYKAFLGEHCVSRPGSSGELTSPAASTRKEQASEALRARVQAMSTPTDSANSSPRAGAGSPLSPSQLSRARSLPHARGPTSPPLRASSSSSHHSSTPSRSAIQHTMPLIKSHMPSSSDIRALFHKHDRSGTGKIRFGQFARAIMPRVPDEKVRDGDDEVRKGHKERRGEGAVTAPMLVTSPSFSSSSSSSSSRNRGGGRLRTSGGIVSIAPGLPLSPSPRHKEFRDEFDDDGEYDGESSPFAPSSSFPSSSSSSATASAASAAAAASAPLSMNSHVSVAHEKLLLDLLLGELTAESKINYAALGIEHLYRSALEQTQSSSSSGADAAAANGEDARTRSGGGFAMAAFNYIKDMPRKATSFGKNRPASSSSSAPGLPGVPGDVDYLTPDDFTRAFILFEINLTPMELASMVHRLDRDDDGRISRTDWCEMFMPLSRAAAIRHDGAHAPHGPDGSDNSDDPSESEGPQLAYSPLSGAGSRYLNPFHAFPSLEEERDLQGVAVVNRLVLESLTKKEEARLDKLRKGNDDEDEPEEENEEEDEDHVAQEAPYNKYGISSSASSSANGSPNPQPRASSSSAPRRSSVQAQGTPQWPASASTSASGAPETRATGSATAKRASLSLHGGSPSAFTFARTGGGAVNASGGGGGGNGGGGGSAAGGVVSFGGATTNGAFNAANGGGGGGALNARYGAGSGQGQSNYPGGNGANGSQHAHASGSSSPYGGNGGAQAQAQAFVSGRTNGNNGNNPNVLAGPTMSLSPMPPFRSIGSPGQQYAGGGGASGSGQASMYSGSPQGPWRGAGAAGGGTNGGGAAGGNAGAYNNGGGGAGGNGASYGASSSPLKNADGSYARPSFGNGGGGGGGAASFGSSGAASAFGPAGAGMIHAQTNGGIGYGNSAGHTNYSAGGFGNSAQSSGAHGASAGHNAGFNATNGVQSSLLPASSSHHPQSNLSNLQSHGNMSSMYAESNGGAGSAGGMNSAHHGAAMSSSSHPHSSSHMSGNMHGGVAHNNPNMTAADVALSMVQEEQQRMGARGGFVGEHADQQQQSGQHHFSNNNNVYDPLNPSSSSFPQSSGMSGSPNQHNPSHPHHLGGASSFAAGQSGSGNMSHGEHGSGLNASMLNSSAYDGGAALGNAAHGGSVDQFGNAIGYNAANNGDGAHAGTFNYDANNNGTDGQHDQPMYSYAADGNGQPTTQQQHDQQQLQYSPSNPSDGSSVNYGMPSSDFAGGATGVAGSPSSLAFAGQSFSGAHGSSGQAQFNGLSPRSFASSQHAQQSPNARSHGMVASPSSSQPHDDASELVDDLANPSLPVVDSRVAGSPFFLPPAASAADVGFENLTPAQAALHELAQSQSSTMRAHRDTLDIVSGRRPQFSPRASQSPSASIIDNTMSSMASTNAASPASSVFSASLSSLPSARYAPSYPLRFSAGSRVPSTNSIHSCLLFSGLHVGVPSAMLPLNESALINSNLASDLALAAGESSVVGVQTRMLSLNDARARHAQAKHDALHKQRTRERREGLGPGTPMYPSPRKLSSAISSLSASSSAEAMSHEEQTAADINTTMQSVSMYSNVFTAATPLSSSSSTPAYSPSSSSMTLSSRAAAITPPTPAPSQHIGGFGFGSVHISMLRTPSSFSVNGAATGAPPLHPSMAITKRPSLIPSRLPMPARTRTQSSIGVTPSVASSSSVPTLTMRDISSPSPIGAQLAKRNLITSFAQER